MAGDGCESVSGAVAITSPLILQSAAVVTFDPVVTVAGLHSAFDRFLQHHWEPNERQHRSAVGLADVDKSEMA